MSVKVFGALLSVVLKKIKKIKWSDKIVNEVLLECIGEMRALPNFEISTS